MLTALTFLSIHDAYAKNLENLLRYVDAKADTSLAFRDRILSQSVKENKWTPRVSEISLITTRVYEGEKGYDKALDPSLPLEGRLNVKTIASEKWPRIIRLRHFSGGGKGDVLETFVYDKEGVPWGFREYNTPWLEKSKTSIDQEPEQVQVLTLNLEPDIQQASQASKGLRRVEKISWFQWDELNEQTQKQALIIYNAAIKTADKEADEYFKQLSKKEAETKKREKTTKETEEKKKQ